MSRFAFFNIFYLSAAAVLGVYGSMFAAFQPAAFWLEVAKLLSFAFFIYFLAIGVVFFVKNKDIIMARSLRKLLKNGFRFNILYFFCIR